MCKISEVWKIFELRFLPRPTADFKVNDKVFLTSNEGVYEIETENDYIVSLNRFNKLIADETLSHNAVSAIAIDENDNLWLGTFRNGIDLIYAPRGNKIKHLEIEEIRNINFFKRQDHL